LHHPRLEELVRRRQRFPIEAYEFVRDAFAHAGPDEDLSALQLLEAISGLARRELGLLAPTVFRLWGVRSTDDIGEIVFDLIDARLIEAASDDCREGFQAAFDLEQALAAGQSIDIPPEEMGP
jgi:uncharacterized repeat protein (TIGR04138 family)